MNLFECFCLVGKDTTRGLNQKKVNAKNIAAEQMLRLYEQRGLLAKLRIRLPDQERRFLAILKAIFWLLR